MADRVDDIIREWKDRHPKVDVASLEVVSRVLRAAHHLQDRLDGVASAYGLSHGGDLDVLTDLYRAGPPHRLTPSELADALLITAGGMTIRLNRLQTAGLVRRSPNPRDRRGVLVSLTKKGEELAEHALATSLAAATESIRTLHTEEQDDLANLLRRLLVGLGDTPPFRPTIGRNLEVV